MYAADRLAAKPILKYHLTCGEVVLCDRYVASNLAHQGAKLPKQEREDFFKWVGDYEFSELKIPKPDLTICLHVPIELTRRALEKERREQDGHEKNADYQQQVYKTYLQLAKRVDWRLVECMKGERRKSIEEVTEEIWIILHPFLAKN